jgi:hypothetical protein
MWQKTNFKNKMRINFCQNRYSKFYKCGNFYSFLMLNEMNVIYVKKNVLGIMWIEKRFSKVGIPKALFVNKYG